MPKIKVKNKEKFDALKGDYSVQDFALNMHKRLVEETKKLSDLDECNISELKKTMAKYPSLFSWAIVEAEILKARYEKIKARHESYTKELYISYYAECQDARVSVKTIESAVYADNRTEIDKLRNEMLDAKAKSDIAQGIVKVWDKSISALQSLSKLYVAEMDWEKRS